jgi:hypothetical protein
MLERTGNRSLGEKESHEVGEIPLQHLFPWAVIVRHQRHSTHLLACCTFAPCSTWPILLRPSEDAIDRRDAERYAAVIPAERWGRLRWPLRHDFSRYKEVKPWHRLMQSY